LVLRYYIDNDKSIKQEGLTVNCKSILIVGLQFRIFTHIPQLFFTKDDKNPEEFSFKPKDGPILFKIFVQEVGTWKVVSLSLFPSIIPRRGVRKGGSG
jgi:hypothetical protein